MEHFKKFERFVQQKADTIRRELDSSKPTKVIKQLEVIAACIGAVSIESLSQQHQQVVDVAALPSALSRHHVPASIFKGSAKWASGVSAPDTCRIRVPNTSIDEDVLCLLTYVIIDDSIGFSASQLVHVFRLLTGPRGSWSSVLRRVSIERVALAPLIQGCCQFLSSTTGMFLTHVSLRGASLGDDSVSYLVDALLPHTSQHQQPTSPWSPHLVELDLSWNQITMAAPLAKLLVMHPTLRLLDVSYNYLGGCQEESGTTATSSQPDAQAASRHKSTGGLLSELTSRLEQTFSKTADKSVAAKTAAAAGRQDVVEEEHTTTSRFFVASNDEDNYDVVSDGATISPLEHQEAMYFLIRELLRPRDDVWMPDTAWAGSIRTVVATHNGISTACVAALQKLLERDCHAIKDRAEQERDLRHLRRTAASATSARGSALQAHHSTDSISEFAADESPDLITEANAHLFVPAVHFSRLILSSEQLAALSESQAVAEVPLLPHAAYTPNGRSSYATQQNSHRSSLNRLSKSVGTRRQHIRRWLQGVDDGDDGVPAGENIYVDERAENAAASTFVAPSEVVAATAPMPKSMSTSHCTSTQEFVGTDSLSQHSVEDKDSDEGARGTSEVHALLRLIELQCTAIEGLLQLQVESALEWSDICTQREQDRSRVQHQEAIEVAQRAHARHIRALAEEMDLRLTQVRHRAAAETRRCDEADARVLALEDRIRSLCAERDGIWADARKQIHEFERTVSQSPRAPPPTTRAAALVASVSCGTDLRMIDLESWRRDVLRRRCERRAKREAASKKTEENKGVTDNQPTISLPQCQTHREVEALFSDDDASDDIVPDSTNTFEIVLRADASFAMMTKDQWQDETTVTKCLQCDRKFDLLNRKHHCRRCGGVHCSKCAPKSPMHGDVRICKGCTTTAGGSRRSSVMGKRERSQT